MSALFNKTFWKFACGFVGILAAGLIVFIIIGYTKYQAELESETAGTAQNN